MPSGNTTTTGENTAGPLTGAEWIRGVQSGGNVKMLTSAIAALYSPTSVIGDMIVRGSSGDGRLSVGPNGYVLFADSTQTLGVKWDGPVVKSADLANAANGFGVDKVGGASRVVSSIAALRALLKTGIGQARVTGYYAAGDGGGGQYFYDSTDTTSADNGGTIIVASDGGRWKMISYALMSPNQFGAKNDGSDCSAAIESAGAWCAPRGITLGFVSATYTVTPGISQVGASTYNTAMTARSGLHCVGFYGATIKVSDNYSTDASPKELAIFSTTSHVGDVKFQGITFDLNGANNLMSPGRPTTYGTFNHFAIVANGTNARIDDLTVDQCTFKNCAGECYIATGFVVPGTVSLLGARATITNNLFINSGLDVADHTSIYAWSEDILCSGNTFWNQTPPHTVGLTGGATCYEVHGSNQRFVNNYCYNYKLGAYVSPNSTNTTLNTIISGNHIYCSDFGILLWRQVGTPNYLEIDGVLITGNTFYFDGYSYTGQGAYKAAVAYQGQISTPQGAINNVKVCNNYAINVGSVLSQFVHWDTSTTASQYGSNLSITENQVIGMNEGVSIITNSANGMGLVEISRNQFISLTPDATANPPHGIYVNAAAGANGIKTLVMKDNSFIDERATPLFDTGIYLAAGTIANLALGPQTFVGMVTANFRNAGATITKSISSVSTSGATTVADGGAIGFNADYVGLTPKTIIATGTVAGQIVTVGTPGASTFPVNIKTVAGAAGTTQLVNWTVTF